MAWRLVRAVFEHSQSRGAARLVLLAIADRADEHTRGAFLSIAQLAAAAKVDDRTVSRSLRELERLGELVITGQARTGAHAFEIAVVAPVENPVENLSKTRGDGNMPPGVMPSGGRHKARGGMAIRQGGDGNMPPLTKRSGTIRNDPEQKIRRRAPFVQSPPSVKVLTSLAESIILERAGHWLGTGFGDLANELKLRAAKAPLAYSADAIRRAIDGAERRVIRRQERAS